MTFQNLFFVFVGGGVGSVFRYLLSKNLSPLFNSPITGTFTVNILGSLLIGFLIGLESRNIIEKPMSFLLVTGFCGGLSTFSTFSFETFELLKQGFYFTAFLNVFLSVAVGLFAIFLMYKSAVQS